MEREANTYMMIAPETYAEQFKDCTIEQCIQARDELLEELKEFELHPRYEEMMLPSPLTQYKVKVDYLKELCDLIKEKVEQADPNYIPEFLSTIEIRKAGITKTGAECVVNAANTYLQQGGGVCGVIFNAAGADRLQKACDKIGGCKTGKAVITPGFDLCKYIIHAVGPVYQDGKHHEPQDLYNCYRTSLDIARENEVASIAFPLISAGIFGYPKEEAWRKALQACDDWIINNNDYQIEIIFAIIDDEILELGNKIAQDLGIGIL